MVFVNPMFMVPESGSKASGLADIDLVAFVAFNDIYQVSGTAGHSRIWVISFAIVDQIRAAYNMGTNFAIFYVTRVGTWRIL